MRFITLIISLLLSLGLISQDVTLGLLSYDITQSYQGFTLIYPHNQSSVFLLNNCGEIVHEWTDEVDFRPGNTAYLLPNGNIAKTKRNNDISTDNIWAGGGGSEVEIRSWDNDLLWNYELNDSLYRLHHDISVMPNGNILMIAWELKTNEEAIAAGRDSSTLNQIVLWPDYVLEMNPETDEVVWEWHVWDHLIQDIDSTKANYGIIKDNPGKININYDTSEGKADWMHTNAIDYNADLDQILISVPTFDEIWVIDHSTTTAQAATDRGGRTNHGGDIIYRVGHPAAYNRGDAGEKILHYQHDAHWTNEFLPANHPDHGKIVCFNNRNPAGYSSVEIFETPWDMYISNYGEFQGTWPPYTFENTITHPDTFALNSSGLSSAQILPNGNHLICSGRFGYIVELTPNNKIVWEYIVPRVGPLAAEQGTTLEINNNLTFRAFRYPPEYTAFENKDLSPKGYMEIDPVQDWCDRLVSTNTPEQALTLVFPNPADDLVYLSWDSGKIIDIEIIDLLGRKRIQARGNGGMKYLDVSSLEPNLYFISIDGVKTMRLLKN